MSDSLPARIAEEFPSAVVLQARDAYIETRDFEAARDKVRDALLANDPEARCPSPSTIRLWFHKHRWDRDVIEHDIRTHIPLLYDATAKAIAGLALHMDHCLHVLTRPEDPQYDRAKADAGKGIREYLELAHKTGMKLQSPLELPDQRAQSTSTADQIATQRATRLLHKTLRKGHN